MTTPHRTLQMALDALDAITDDVDGTGLNTMPSFDKAIDAIATLPEALAQPEPIDGFGGNLDEAFEPAPAVPDDAALNTLAKLFHRGEEIEGDDGAAMMVDLSLWHEASEAFDSLIGDGDGETLASSAAPAVREPQDERAAFEAWIRKDSGDLTTFGSGSNMHYRNSAVNNAWTGWQARAHGNTGATK